MRAAAEPAAARAGRQRPGGADGNIVRCALGTHPVLGEQRVTEATGVESKTIHRLSEVDPKSRGFTLNAANSEAIRPGIPI
jgi:hypothetical protein